MNQPPLNPDALEAASEAIRAGDYHGVPDDEIDDMAAYLAVSAYLAVALPEVTSVEAIPAQVQVISWEEEPEHECWKLAPDETFVGLVVKSGRSWTPRDKYTLNIERPEVNDA